MRKYYLVAIMLIAGLSLSYSQVETNYYNSGEATKHINMPVRSMGIIKEMPSFDLAQLEKEDAERDSIGGMFRFGKPFDVSYTLADGQWDDVEGGRVWSMTFKSKDALSLNFIFNNFRLPEGAELYVVNKDESVLFGPVTKECTTENGYFLTDVMKGDQATIYLFEPTDSKDLSSLTISRVVHGYRDLEITRNADRSVNTPDVACYPEYSMESDAVAMILYSSAIYVGTGFLIMSTDCSFRPYLLTSSYIVDTNNNGSFTNSEISSAENCMFKFRYKKTQCGGANYATSYTYNQAYFRAGWNNSKFALLELKGNLKCNMTLSWLGWNYNDEHPTSGACIHHPGNDGMKISTFNHYLGYDSCTYYLWDVKFDEGDASFFSRGAPLLNQYKRVVGQVHSVYTSINQYNQSVLHTDVGKLSRSWNGGGSDTTRLKNWLDPDDTGRVYMNSSRSLGNLQIIGDSAISMDGSSSL